MGVRIYLNYGKYPSFFLLTMKGYSHPHILSGLMVILQSHPPFVSGLTSMPKQPGHLRFANVLIKPQRLSQESLIKLTSIQPLLI